MATSNSSYPVVKGDAAKRVERPYKCIVCDVSYAASDELDSHLTSPEHLEASSTFTRKLVDEHAMVGVELLDTN